MFIGLKNKKGEQLCSPLVEITLLPVIFYNESFYIFNNELQMEIIESYNKTELAEMENTPYSRITKDRDFFIPVKIITAQSRATKRGYTIRYIKVKDVKEYLKDNKYVRRYKKSLDK